MEKFRETRLMRTTVLLIALAALASAQAQKETEWPTYNAGLAGTRYRALDQINASNFSKLEVAWRFKTDSIGNRRFWKADAWEYDTAWEYHKGGEPARAEEGGFL